MVRRGFRKAPPQPRRKINVTEFKEGHEKKAGRKAGVPNRITTSIKQAILDAVALCGADGKGKDGAVGYLFNIARTEPGLMVRLLEKILPTQLTGANEGPIRLVALPPEILAGLPDAELAVMEAVYARLQSGKVSVGPDAQQGDADAYAESLRETHH